MQQLRKNILESVKILTLAIFLGAAVASASTFTSPSGTPASFNAPVPINTSATAQTKDGPLFVQQLGASYADPSALSFLPNDGLDIYGNAWFQGGNYFFSGKTNLLGNVDIGPTQGGSPVAVNLTGALETSGTLTINTDIVSESAGNEALHVDSGTVKISDLPLHTGPEFTIPVCVQPDGILIVCPGVTVSQEGVSNNTLFEDVVNMLR